MYGMKSNIRVGESSLGGAKVEINIPFRKDMNKKTHRQT
jgi:hypothetical protein